jgi:hypothetical protein
VSETYDLFELNKVDNSGTYEIEGHNDQYVGTGSNVRTSIKDEERTNPFRGFFNGTNFNAENPDFTVAIAGKHFAPHAFNSVNILTDGTIECFPPPIHPVGWKSVTFKCFSYKMNLLNNSSKFSDYINDNFIDGIIQTYAYYIEGVKEKEGVSVPAHYPEFSPFADDEATTPGARINVNQLTKYDKCPLFIKWDEYPSRSKVVMSRKSKCLTYVFGQPWGPDEPIRLSLSLSGSMSGYDEQLKTRFNTKLNQQDIADLLVACSFVIEWEAMSNDESKHEE